MARSRCQSQRLAVLPLYVHFSQSSHLPRCNSNQIDSGHGGQTKDLDGDEDDGYDEGDDCVTLISQQACADRLRDSYLPG
jgi:hypothetical protein